VRKADFYFFPAAEPEQVVPEIVRLVKEAIPQRFGFHPIDDIQVLTPMQRGDLGARNLNRVLQQALNPTGAFVERFGWKFRVGDKVMQTVNDYEKDVFNGDIGRIVRIEEFEKEITIRYEDRQVVYDFNELDELLPSYAITIHKSQGSEYPVVVVPIHTQHYMMLQRNLLYTAATRGKKLVVLVGAKKAIWIAVKRLDSTQRITTLRDRLMTA
jgi:exodeoxyribonuclease V alpha subunit